MTVRRTDRKQRTDAFFYALCLASCAFNVWAKPFDKTTLDTLIHDASPNQSVGLIIMDPENGKLRYQHRAFEAFPTASTTKLITSYAAVKTLGPTYRFKTTISANGNDTKDVIVRFSGDPSLTESDLAHLFDKSKITVIYGDLILSRQMALHTRYPNGMQIDDRAWYFAPPLSPFTLNENRIHVTMLPATGLDAPYEAKATGTFAPIKLRSQMQAVSESEAAGKCQAFIDQLTALEYRLDGCWPHSRDAQNLHLAQQYPEDYLLESLSQILSDKGIVLKGKIRFDDAPENTQIVASHYSAPLTKLLEKVLGESNNLYAHALIYAMGQTDPGDAYRNGLHRVQRFAEQTLGLSHDEFVFEDGAGFTYNLFSPWHLARTLYLIEKDDVAKPIFDQALAVNGTSGTLRHRMVASDVRGLLYGKTGFRTGVSALAGVLKRAEGDLIVVVMQDHLIKANPKARAFENKLIEILG